ncbi:hypothetical protein KR009_000669 [Drosophila setifemur]|nr:hypothetical protein KR009_000669 [Drosophila setifemur]
MSAKSKILEIGTSNCEKSSKTNNPAAYFEFDFEKRMQKILLDGRKPNPPDEDQIERFAATQIMRNGKQYYEFGPDKFKTGVMFSGPSFSPINVLSHVKNRIGKEHWVAENVVQYKKNSMQYMQGVASQALDDESLEIYQYLNYLNERHSK